MICVVCENPIEAMRLKMNPNVKTCFQRDCVKELAQRNRRAAQRRYRERQKEAKDA